jgi:flagellar motor switch protein FliG
MFPHPEETRDPINSVGYHFDDFALQQVVDALPDPVMARITHMCDMKLQPRFLAALGKRIDRMGISLERETEPDRQKDEIVQKAVTKVVNQLMKQGRIVSTGMKYAGKKLTPAGQTPISRPL